MCFNTMALVVVLVSLCLLLNGSSALTSEEKFYANYEAAFKAYNESGGTWDDIGIQSTSKIRPIDVKYDASCDISTMEIPKPPTNIHELSPKYVKVIGAVGDSVSAGFDESGVLWDLLFKTEFRGAAWTAGGDKDVVTLPNFIRDFQTDDMLYGYATGTGKATSRNAVLNRAVSGAVASDIPGQVADLIDKMNEYSSDGKFDMANDWKIVTLWIGGNDLCAYCSDQNGYSPENYGNNIRNGLELIAKNIPKVFVNVVEIFDITELKELDTNLLCDIIHGFACNCKKDKDTSDAQTKYNDKLEKVVDDINVQYADDDFVAVLQPFLKNVKLPAKDPGSYFGPDCFHFNYKGHAEIALALWNSMLTPVDEKDDSIYDWDYTIARCPQGDHMYFATKENSRKSSVFSLGNGGPDSGDGNSLALILGTSLSAFVVVLVLSVVLVVGAVVYVRHRRRQNSNLPGASVSVSMDTEKTRLIFRQ